METKKLKRAVCVLLTLKSGMVLALKRSDNGLYGLPGGKAEENESVIDAAVRECQEETGYVVALSDRTPYVGRVSDFLVTTFTALYIERVSKPLTPDEGEVKWVNEFKLTDYNTCAYAEYNKNVFRHFQ
jgi:8-oxo-dGTP diphosphatase